MIGYWTPLTGSTTRLCRWWRCRSRWKRCWWRAQACSPPCGDRCRRKPAAGWWCVGVGSCHAGNRVDLRHHAGAPLEELVVIRPVVLNLQRVLPCEDLLLQDVDRAPEDLCAASMGRRTFIWARNSSASPAGAAHRRCRGLRLRSPAAPGGRARGRWPLKRRCHSRTKAVAFWPSTPSRSVAADRSDWRAAAGSRRRRSSRPSRPPRSTRGSKAAPFRSRATPRSVVSSDVPLGSRRSKRAKRESDGGNCSVATAPDLQRDAASPAGRRRSLPARRTIERPAQARVCRASKRA